MVHSHMLALQGYIGQLLYITREGGAVEVRLTVGGGWQARQDLGDLRVCRGRTHR